jgi:hypothetical protein
MRGAQITIRCDCGDIGYAAYGERWVCPKCGRAWIPADEYWGIMRDQRRMRLTVLGVVLAITVPIAALVPFLGIPILFLLPVLMGFWFMFYMPRWRRRVREQARNMRKWELRPD